MKENRSAIFNSLNNQCNLPRAAQYSTRFKFLVLVLNKVANTSTMRSAKLSKSLFFWINLNTLLS